VTTRTCPSSWAARTLFCALVASAQLTSGRAFAYRTAGDLTELASTPKVRWEDSVIEYEINEKGAPGVAISDVQSAIADAARSWASVACGGPDFRYRGLTSNHAVPSDRRNTIEWVSDWSARGFSADAAGQTDVQYEKMLGGEWQIVEADVYLNAENHAWTTLVSTDESLRDVSTVLIHELGHVIGLMHPCEPAEQGNTPRCDDSFGRPTMHPIYGADQLSLEADDEAGACFLYPSTSCTESSCGADQLCTRDGCRESCGGRACAGSETCVSGVCVSPPLCPGGICPQTCAVSTDCDLNQACVSGVCRSGQGERGDLCTHAEDCRTGNCVDGFCAVVCDALQSCENGETCNTDQPEAVCVSPLRRMGETCKEAHDCLGNQCLEGGEGGPVCTRLCSPDAPCGSDWACSTVKGRAVCTPPWFGSAGGCSLVASNHERPALGRLAGLGLAVVLLLRRRSRRRLLVSRCEGRS
jgi:hypothetical protein